MEELAHAGGEEAVPLEVLRQCGPIRPRSLAEVVCEVPSPSTVWPTQEEEEEEKEEEEEEDAMCCSRVM